MDRLHDLPDLGDAPRNFALLRSLSLSFSGHQGTHFNTSKYDWALLQPVRVPSLRSLSISIDYLAEQDRFGAVLILLLPQLHAFAFSIHYSAPPRVLEGLAHAVNLKDLYLSSSIDDLRLVCSVPSPLATLRLSAAYWRARDVLGVLRSTSARRTPFRRLVLRPFQTKDSEVDMEGMDELSRWSAERGVELCVVAAEDVRRHGGRDGS